MSANARNADCPHVRRNSSTANSCRGKIFLMSQDTRLTVDDLISEPARSRA